MALQKPLKNSGGKLKEWASGDQLTSAFLKIDTNLAIEESSGFQLPTALSTDGIWVGITTNATLGETIAFGEVCYFKSDGKWYKAKADVVATSSGKLGVCVAAGVLNDAKTMLLYGYINAASLYPSGTIGAPAWLSAATAGLIATAAPSGTTDFVNRVVGFFNTADELFFNPSNDYITIN